MKKEIINVVDAPCGYGKTSWAIQYMNSMPTESHQFIFITPFLDEVDRVKESVTKRKFYDPVAVNGKTKLDDLHIMLREGKDICTTHALFQLANQQTIELLRANRYTLILDEVMNVIEQVKLKRDDLKFLLEAEAISIISRENGLSYVSWNQEKKDYDTKYNSVKNIALTNNLMYCDSSALIWNFPCEIFLSFQNVFLLTYMFEGQIQRAYYDLHNLGYRYLSVAEIDSEYRLVPYNERNPYDKERLRKMISVYDGKLNEIGSGRYMFSKRWFEKTKNKHVVESLSKNARNYFMNICKVKCEEVMWTTVKGDKIRKQKQGKGNIQGKIERQVSPKSYATSFVSMTSRATNEHKNKHTLAYLVNRFLSPIEKKFFEQYDVEIDQDAWAISELIQWVWRSRIRDDKPINIYIPSKRMRDLFIAYLNSEKFEEAPKDAIVDELSSDWNI